MESNNRATHLEDMYYSESGYYDIELATVLIDYVWSPPLDAPLGSERYIYRKVCGEGILFRDEYHDMRPRLDMNKMEYDTKYNIPELYYWRKEDEHGWATYLKPEKQLPVQDVKMMCVNQEFF